MTNGSGGCNLLHFKSVQLYFGEVLDLEIKQYLENNRYRFLDNLDLYLENVSVIFHHGQNLEIMRHSLEFTNYWKSNNKSTREKLGILSKLYSEYSPEYRYMIVALIADWKTALEYLQNRLNQVTNISLAWEELYILKDRQVTRDSASQMLEQTHRKIKEVHNMECQIIINSVPGGANPNSNVPNPIQRSLTKMHCEFKLIKSHRKFVEFYQVRRNASPLIKMLRYYDLQKFCIKNELKKMLFDYIKNISQKIPDDSDHGNFFVKQSDSDRSEEKTEEVQTGSGRQNKPQAKKSSNHISNHDVISLEVDNLINRQNNTHRRNYNTPRNQISDETWIQPMRSNFQSTIARDNQGNEERWRRNDGGNDDSFTNDAAGDDESVISEAESKDSSKIETLKAIKLKKQILQIINRGKTVLENSNKKGEDPITSISSLHTVADQIKETIKNFNQFIPLYPSKEMKLS